MAHLRHVILGVFLALASTPLAWAQSAPPTIIIHLSNFEFNPSQLRLRVGVPVHLQLVNDSGGGHNFSAPAFFAASIVQAGTPPRDGTIDVPARGHVDITLVPRMPGTYRLKCTHFLHSLFGMTGTIIVESSLG
jgi:plastocyanin